MKIKFFILATVWVISGVFVCGCIVIDGNSFRIETVSGSGTVISEERAVPTFNQISLKGPGKVILTKGENQNVQVNTDANIMPHIRTEVKDDRLVISHGKKNLRPTVLTFHITVANLKGVSISGSGLISGNDEFNSDSFYADIAGSGDIAINVAANNLESNISGSGSIYLSGTANSYNATITGSGDVDAFELQARESSVVITGSGNCRVNVSDLLQAKITGSGDVLYKGHPQISQSITGSGKVKDRNIDNIHGIVVIRNGKLVLEEYFGGFDRETKHCIFSASKSVTSILIGMALDRRMIEGVDSRVYEFFPEYEGTRWIDRRYDINLKQALTMTAGLKWIDWEYPGYDSRDTTRQMTRSSDWLEFVLNRDTIEPPGKQFAYNNGLTMLLGGIIKNTSGQNAINFADKNLFARLGISDYTWDRGSNGIANTAWGLSMKPRDMAKIGYLFLKGGKWHNKRIVSQHWVDDSVRDYAKQDVFLGTGYGYQWWYGKTIIDGQAIEAFYAAGHGGQYIFLCPSLDCVTVVTSKWIGNPLGEFRPQMLLVNFILPAMLSTVSPEVINPEPSTLEKYSGEYQFLKWKLKATVRRQADRLYLDLPKSAEKELRPLAENQFLYSLEGYGDVRLEFPEDRSGEITQMVAYFGFANITFRKTS